MLESQFYARIVLTALFGILFILSMLNKGKKNAIENTPKKNIALKILSVFFLVSSLVSLVVGIIAITDVKFPAQMIDQPITAHMVLRPSYATLIWGYPTYEQNRALMNISSVFASLAIAAYFAVFKKSGTNGWQKFLKVVCIILMYFFYASSADLHYFDVYELYAPIIFLILAFTGLIGGKKAVVEEEAKEVPSQVAASETKIDHEHTFADEQSPETTETKIETTDVEL